MMPPFQAINLGEGIEDEEYAGQVIEAWQYLHDTRVAYQLQGSIGRACRDLLREGIISDHNVIILN